MKKTNFFVSSMIWGLVGKLGEIGLSLFFAIFIVRLLDQRSYGEYSAAINLIGLVSFVLGLGLSETLIRYAPLFRQLDDRGPLLLFYRFGLIRLGLSGLVGLVLWLGNDWLAEIFNQPILKSDPLLVAALSILYNLLDLLIAYYAAILRVRRFVLVRLFGQAFNIFLVGSLLFLGHPSALNLLSTIFIANLLIIGLGSFNLLPIRRENHNGLKLSWPAELKPKTVCLFSRDMCIINIVNFGLMGQIDILILTSFNKNLIQVSYYSIASLLLSRLWSLINGWTGSLNAITTTVLLEQGMVSLKRYYGYYYRFSVLIHLIPVAGLTVLAGPIVTILFGSNYQPVVLLTALFMFHQSIEALIGVAINQYFINALSWQNRLLWFRCLVSLVNVALDFLLVPQLGALGTVIATTVANLLLHISEISLIRQLFRELNFGYTIKVSLSVAASSLLAWLLPLEGFVGLLVKGVVYLGAIAGFFVLFKPLETTDQQLMIKLQPRLARVTQFLVKN